MKINKYHIAHIITWVLLACIALSACKTKQERSRRLIERANKLYPIELQKDTLLKIDTVFSIDTFFIVKKDTIFIQTKIDVDHNGKIKPFTNKLLLDNEKAQVFGSIDQSGNLSVSVELKERKQAENFKIHFKKIYLTKRIYIKSPPQIVKVKDWFWYTGLLFWIAFIGFAGFKIFRYFR